MSVWAIAPAFARTVIAASGMWSPVTVGAAGVTPGAPATTRTSMPSLSSPYWRSVCWATISAMRG